MIASTPNVTKEAFLNGVACRALAWYSVWKPSDEPTSAGDLFLLEEGKEVHRRARSVFPDAVFAGTVEKTSELLSREYGKVILEAAFKVDGYVARADALQRLRSGYRLVEVKSGLFDEGKVDPDYIDDLAYTFMVLRRSGVKIARAELMLLSRDWRLGMPDDQLFVIADHTKAVRERADEFEAEWESVRRAVAGQKRPAPTLLKDCGKCGYFESHCLGKGVKDPIFDLPRLSAKRFEELCEADSLSIHDIPKSVELTPPQERVRESVLTGRPVVDAKTIRSMLDEVEWPAFYLDFETVKTSLPFWKDVAPHEQIVTQYSIHRCSAPGTVTNHTEYLADHREDCRQVLAERLLKDLEGAGSIVHYSPFEKTTINGLAKRFPKLAKRLLRLVDRLFDLEPLFRDGYYHPGFRGQSSIKATLPVLIKGMRYDGLSIGDGGAAMAAFAKMARGQCSEGEAKRLRAGLMEYCGQDTMAMVRLHEKVAGPADPMRRST